MNDPLYSGVVLFSGGAVYNVKAFGATGLGVHDDSEGIRDAAAALQHAGGGTLLFPPGTYRVFDRQGTLVSFTGLNGVNVTGMGATLAISPDRRFERNSTQNAFEFMGCSNVVVDGFRGTGPRIDYSDGQFRGVNFVHLYGRNTNVRMPSNRLQGWMAGLVATREFASPDPVLNGTSQNIEIGVLEVTDGLYGINCANSGDGLRVNRLRCERTFRTYFVYGVRNHRVNVEGKDTFARSVVLFTGEDPSGRGIGCEDIDVTLVDRETTRATGNQDAKVVLGWNGAPAALRDIRVRLDLEYRPGVASGGAALRIEKRARTGGGYDDADHGHVLENFTLSGTVRGRPSWPGPGLIHTARENAWGKRGTRDRWTNVLFQNLRLDSPVPSDLDVEALDRITLVNVHSNAPIALRGRDGRQTSRRTRVEAVNSTIPNLHELVVSAADGTPGEGDSFFPLGSKAVDAARFGLPAAWSGSMVDNRLLAAPAAWTLPRAEPGMQFTLLRIRPHDVDVRPHAPDRIRGAASGAPVRLDLDGAALSLRCVERGVWEVVSARGVAGLDA